MLLMARRPAASRRCTIQEGDAPSLTPRITRAVYRGHKSGASTCTSVSSLAAGLLVGTRLRSGSFSSRPSAAASSRATPMWPRQSGRLEVISRSNTTSVSVSITSSQHSPIRVSSSPNCLAGTAATST